MADSQGLLAEVTLDRLACFVAVVDGGSFSAAARQLGRMHGAISYNIQTLETQLEVALFDRSGYRPEPTDVGRSLVAPARRLLSDAHSFAAMAKARGQGLEATISVVVDIIFPPVALALTIRDFRQAFPTVLLHVKMGVLGEVLEQVESGVCDMGVHGFPDPGPEMVIRPCTTVELMPLASATHPLAQTPGPIAESILDEHIHLILADRSGRTDTGHYDFQLRNVWRLPDMYSRYQLLREGVGWARIPRHQANEDLNSGRVRVLPLERGPGRRVALRLIYLSTRRLGLAGRWLADRFSSLWHDRAADKPDAATEILGPESN